VFGTFLTNLNKWCVRLYHKVNGEVSLSKSMNELLTLSYMKYAMIPSKIFYKVML